MQQIETKRFIMLNEAEDNHMVSNNSEVMSPVKKNPTLGLRMDLSALNTPINRNTRRSSVA
jgi:hypothetical protein